MPCVTKDEASFFPKILASLSILTQISFFTVDTSACDICDVFHSLSWQWKWRRRQQLFQCLGSFTMLEIMRNIIVPSYTPPLVILKRPDRIPICPFSADKLNFWIFRFSRNSSCVAQKRTNLLGSYGCRWISFSVSLAPTLSPTYYSMSMPISRNHLILCLRGFWLLILRCRVHSSYGSLCFSSQLIK